MKTEKILGIWVKVHIKGQVLLFPTALWLILNARLVFSFDSFSSFFSCWFLHTIGHVHLSCLKMPTVYQMHQVLGPTQIPCFCSNKISWEIFVSLRLFATSCIFACCSSAHCTNASLLLVLFKYYADFLVDRKYNLYLYKAFCLAKCLAACWIE